MKRSSFIIGLLFVAVSITNGQTGGDNTYEFLNLTHSGLISSLGGSNVSLYTDNLNLSYHNPALLNSEMQNNAALDYVNYFAGVNYGLAMYSWNLANKGIMAGGVTFYRYGKFTGADESGVITGTFVASEFSFPVTYSRVIDSLFSIGITAKPVLSHLESYTSFGVAFDIGAAYHDPSGLFSAGITIKNAGLQITRYAGEERMKLPFEIQAGASQRLEHAPLRFSVTLRHLEKYNLIYEYEETMSKSTYLAGSRFLDNTLRHVVLGVELIPHENFYFSGGYNYQRRKELGIEEKTSTVGLSWGFGIKTSLLDLEFARASYHLAGSSTHLSMIVKWGNINNKRNIIN